MDAPSLPLGLKAPWVPPQGGKGWSAPFSKRPNRGLSVRGLSPSRFLSSAPNLSCGAAPCPPPAAPGPEPASGGQESALAGRLRCPWRGHFKGPVGALLSPGLEAGKAGASAAAQPQRNGGAFQALQKSREGATEAAAEGSPGRSVPPARKKDAPTGRGRADSDKRRGGAGKKAGLGCAEPPRSKAVYPGIPDLGSHLYFTGPKSPATPVKEGTPK